MRLSLCSRRPRESPRNAARSQPSGFGRSLALFAVVEKIRREGEGGFTGDNVTGTIYQHSDFHGASMFLNLSVGGLLPGFVSLNAFNF